MVWTEDLTESGLKMLMASGDDRYGVELRGSAWSTARALVGHGLGSIEGDPGGELPGLFFANAEGVEVIHEFDDLKDEPVLFNGD